MRRATVITLLMLCCTGVHAEEINKFSLELEFSHDQIPLGDRTQLDVDGIGIRYSEQTALPLRLTLSLGHEEASHHDDPLALGYQPNGYYAGITLGGASPRWHSLQLGIDLDYSYHSTDQELNQQRLEIDWHRAEARAWLAVHINDAVKLYGCAIAVDIDGSQTFSGSTPSQIDFSGEHRRGYCGGVQIETGDDGFIGIEAESRHQRGGRLYFGRRYRL